MRPPLDRVDEVGEGEDAFEVAVVVLEPDVDRDAVPLPGEDDGRGEEGRLAAVQILDEGPYAPVEVVLLLFPRALVLHGDGEPRVQKRQLPKAALQHVQGVVDLLEDRVVGEVVDQGAAPIRGGPRREVGDGNSPFEPLGALHAVARDRDLQPGRERVDHRDAHAVKSARDLVGAVPELSPRVQDGEDDLAGRTPVVGVRVRGDAAPVVPDADALVRVDGDLDAVAVAADRLVYGVVDDLVDEVMEAPAPGVPDVHAGALANGLESFQYLYASGVVAALRVPCVLSHLAAFSSVTICILDRRIPDRPKRSQPAMHEAPRAKGAFAVFLLCLPPRAADMIRLRVGFVHVGIVPCPT